MIFDETWYIKSLAPLQHNFIRFQRKIVLCAMAGTFQIYDIAATGAVGIVKR